MRNLSVKARVNLFYTVILIAVLSLVSGFLLVTADQQVQNISVSALESAVKDATEDISYYDDRIEIDPDFPFYHNGVTVSLYGPSGTPIAGTLPNGFPPSTPLIADENRSVESAEETWLVYDLYLKHPDASGIWIRGVYSMNDGLMVLGTITKAALIGLPVFLLLAVWGGHFVTKRAFAPIARIRDAAEQISAGNHLSQRIQLSGNRDEFHALGVTLNSMFDRLEQAFENERQFTSDVSHELRTPISVILSQCDYTLAAARDPGEYIMAIKNVQEQATSMSLLVAQLLELSRGVDVQSLLNKEPVVLADLCESIAEEMQDAAKEKGIRIIQKLDPGITVLADQTQIMRLLINLISNAIRYGKQGGFVMLELERSETYARITVSDDGIGISSEHLSKVFRRFYQVDKARSQKQHNSFGLGLSYVKWITEAHGGHLQVRSTEGVGTAFEIYLPLLQS